MEDIVKSIIPAIMILLGWGLNELSGNFKERRLDKRKINNLLFNLLEIRYNAVSLMNFDKEFKTIMDRFIQKYFTKQDAILERGNSTIVNSIGGVLKNNLPYISSMTPLINIIDENVDEISEFYPVLAYKLKNEYNFKQKFQSLKAYIVDIQKKFDVYESHLIMNQLEPFFFQKFVERIDVHIEEVSKILGRNQRKRVKEILKKSEDIDFEHIDSEVDRLIKLIDKTLRKDEKESLDSNG